MITVYSFFIMANKNETEQPLPAYPLIDTSTRTGDSEEERRKFVRAVLDNPNKTGFGQLNGDDQEKVVGVMTELSLHIDLSIEKFGGISKVLSLELLMDLGMDSSDPTTPFLLAVSSLKSLGLRKGNSPRITTESFIKRYHVFKGKGLSDYTSYLKSRQPGGRHRLPDGLSS